MDKQERGAGDSEGYAGSPHIRYYRPAAHAAAGRRIWGRWAPPGLGGSRRASFTALMVLLAASTMVFAALTSAYFMRRGVSGDWRAISLPPLLWANTVVLLVSSGLLEAARWGLHTGRRTAFNGCWTAATVCGTCS